MALILHTTTLAWVAEYGVTGGGGDGGGEVVTIMKASFAEFFQQVFFKTVFVLRALL